MGQPAMSNRPVSLSQTPIDTWVIQAKAILTVLSININGVGT